jgi:predicted AlkP superfamily pyrophosphatase or phosphodiesterase
MPTMLPSVPKSLGRLSDVFVSALGSITGIDNRLKLPRVNSACVVLVDGLGSFNLKANSGHAPFLAKQLELNGSTHCGFPSTTAASITSFGTGVSAGSHGIIGYQVQDPESGKVLNLLTGWGAGIDPQIWQPKKTVNEMATESGVETFVIGPPEYDGSGFSVASMRGAKYIAAKSFDDRVAKAQQVLSTKQKSLVYLYFPELDQRAHAFGVDSQNWREKLEDLDAAIKSLAQGLPKNSGLLLTADHGVIDVPRDKHIYLDEYNDQLSGLTAVGGDPRVLFLYFKGLDTAELQIRATQLNVAIGGAVTVLTKEEIIKSGWYGEVSSEASDRMPELFMVTIGTWALYHRDYAKPKSLNMIGQHGSISAEELTVPLLRFGAFAQL